MNLLQSRLSRTWNNLTASSRQVWRYGIERKFYPIYVENLEADKKLLEEHFHVKAEVDLGGPASSVLDPSGTLCYVARLSIALDADVVARVFLKYCLDGKEIWWTNIRGPRAKMFAPLFRVYFEEETTKKVRP